MAIFVFDNAYFSFNSVALSDHVKSVTVNYSGELHDITAMAATARVRKGGLNDWSVEVEFYADFAASEIYATFFTLVGGDASGDGDTIIVGPEGSTASATNPQFTGTAILETFPVISGNVGDIMMTPCVFQGSGALTATVE